MMVRADAGPGPSPGTPGRRLCTTPADDRRSRSPIAYRACCNGISADAAACREPENQFANKIRLIPGHCDPTVNLYDWYVAIRDNRVEQLWPITAGGPVY